MVCTTFQITKYSALCSSGLLCSHYSLHNNPEECGSQLLRNVSLNSESKKFSAYSPIPCYSFIQSSTSVQLLRLLACTRALFYWTVLITTSFRLFQVTLGTQCSVLFQSVMSQGPSILVQCLAVYIRVFIHHIHSEVLEMFSFSLQISVIYKKKHVNCVSIVVLSLSN